MQTASHTTKMAKVTTTRVSSTNSNRHTLAMAKRPTTMTSMLLHTSLHKTIVANPLTLGATTMIISKEAMLKTDTTTSKVIKATNTMTTSTTTRLKAVNNQGMLTMGMRT